MRQILVALSIHTRVGGGGPLLLGCRHQHEPARLIRETVKLRSKPDADEALDRMERWWLRENSDRPILTIGVQRPPLKTKRYESQRERWLDFDFRVEQAIDEVEHGTYLGETFPTFEPNLGPDILSTIFGLDLEFAEDTSWGTPIVETLGEILDLKPCFDAPLWKAVERFQAMGLDAGDGRWITLFTDLHPNADVPAALLGPQALCLAFADDLDLVRQVIEHVTPACVEAYRRQIRPLIDAGLPVGTWIRAFSMKPSYVPEADFTALIGPEMFAAAVLPSILQELAETDRAIYHLDGPTSLHHLDLVLAVPNIHAVQWVFGAGNGPASRWAHIYRRILDSGKGIAVEAESPADILELHPILGNEGVWYRSNFEPLPLHEARELLAAIS